MARLLLLAGSVATVGLVAQPVSSGPIRLALLLTLAAALVGALVLARRWWLRGLALLPLAAVAAVALLPGGAHDTAVLQRAYVHQLGTYEGTRFVWGGENSLGVDCSGLVRRALMVAAVERGLREFDPALWRRAAHLWWNDASARALGDGYLGLTRHLFDARRLDAVDHGRLRPGDLAVTADGIHVLAFAGGQTWIEADPQRGRVIRLSAARDGSLWLRVPVRLVRWRALE
jgi:hypothetical protein